MLIEQLRPAHAPDYRALMLEAYALHPDAFTSSVAGLSFESREKLRHKATPFGMYEPARCRQQGLGRSLVQAVLAQAGARPGVRLGQLTVTVTQGNDAAPALLKAAVLSLTVSSPLPSPQVQPMSPRSTCGATPGSPMPAAPKPWNKP